MYVFLTGLLKVQRRTSPYNMDQIHLLKYSVTKRFGENDLIEKS